MRNGGVTEDGKHGDEHAPAKFFDNRMGAHVALPLYFPLMVFSIIPFCFLVNYFLLWAMLSHPLNKVQMKIWGQELKMDPRLQMSGMTECGKMDPRLRMSGMTEGGGILGKME
jgi:hypothetical protein